MPTQQYCARFWLARLACAAFAQVAARLSGSIVDPSGTAVPGGATPIGRAQAGDQDLFTIPSLRPGSDDLAVTADGFRRQTVRGLQLETGRELSLNTIRLEVGTVAETAEVSTTVTNAQISRLPMFNRSPLGLIITPPGVTNGRGPTTVNGMRQSAVSVWRRARWERHHDRWAWLLVALYGLLIGLGNGSYHYSPDNQTLFWDRLPMTLNFMAVFSSEHGMPISADQDYDQARVTRDIVVLIVGAPNARLRVGTADMKQEIRCYDYVNHPYENVRNALRQDAIAVFRAATKAAESRAQSVAAELRVDMGGVVIGADILISVKSIEESGSGESPAATMPGLFPMMQAKLFVYPLTPTETQLDFAGVYEPPLGPLGGLLNAAGGHRIADLSVHRFVTSVAEHLRQTAG